jgi:hypothetical protein
MAHALLPLPHRIDLGSMALLVSMLRLQAALLDGEGDHVNAAALRSRAGCVQRGLLIADIRRGGTSISRIPAHA